MGEDFGGAAVPRTMERLPGKSSRGRGKGLALFLLAIVVTLLTVFFVLNYRRWVTIDFLAFDVRTRVIWAMLAPLGVGLILGAIGGRISRR